MRTFARIAFAVFGGCLLLWAGTRLLVPAVFRAGYLEAGTLERICCIGIGGAPIIGWVIIELSAGCVIWWPHPMTKRRDDPVEYWFSVGLKVALIIAFAVLVFRQ